MPKRKCKHTSSSKSSLLREIDELDKEISDLETKCEQQEIEITQELSFETLDKIVEKLSDSYRASSDRVEDESADKIQEEIETFITRKGKLEGLTGFVFEEDRVVLISRRDNNNNSSEQQWQRVLKGKCLDISFEVDFVTDQKEKLSKQGEEEKEKSQSYAEVTKLDVKVNNLIAQYELDIFLTNVKEENALGNFLQVLPRYARCHICRKKSFLHFKTKYPELVFLIPGTDYSMYMEICNRQKSGIQFTVCWDILVEKSGNVVPQLDTFAFCSGDVGEEDNDIVKSTPEMFRKILSQYDVEKAIELLISIVNE